MQLPPDPLHQVQSLVIGRQEEGAALALPPAPLGGSVAAFVIVDVIQHYHGLRAGSGMLQLFR
jgi:hypothetical protein